MTGLGRVAPNFGIRFELTLSRGDAEGAEYVCVARAQHETYEGLARIAIGVQNIELQGFTDCPAWAETFVVSLLRTATRGAEGTGWPRRITRWRSEPTRSRRGEPAT